MVSILCPDGGLELVHRLVILDDRSVYRRRWSAPVEVGVVTHDHFGAVRRVGIVERNHSAAFLERERACHSCDFECHNLKLSDKVNTWVLTWIGENRDIPRNPWDCN